MTSGRRAPLAGVGTLAAVVGRPDLWFTALRVLGGVLQPGWWRRWPPVPRVPPAYLEWRRTTMWGDEHPGGLGADEAVAYLAWCRRMRRSR